MRLALIVSPLALLAFAPALAQSQPGVPVAEAAQAGTASAEDLRVNQLLVYGDDPCPAGTNDEITVCARLPEDDRFRIPSNLRENPNDPAGQSWANRASELSYVGRTGTESCSTVGGGGFTGCFNQMVRQALAERRGGEQVNWARLIEEARQERLNRIDRAIRAEGDEVDAPD